MLYIIMRLAQTHPSHDIEPIWCLIILFPKTALLQKVSVARTISLRIGAPPPLADYTFSIKCYNRYSVEAERNGITSWLTSYSSFPL